MHASWRHWKLGSPTIYPSFKCTQSPYTSMYNIQIFPHLVSFFCPLFILEGRRAMSPSSLVTPSNDAGLSSDHPQYIEPLPHSFFFSSYSILTYWLLLSSIEESKAIPCLFECTQRYLTQCLPLDFTSSNSKTYTIVILMWTNDDLEGQTSYRQSLKEHILLV